jgi:hypothetical protein
MPNSEDRVGIDTGESLLSHHDTVAASLKRALYSPAWFVFLVVLLLLSLFSFVMFVANVSRKEAWFVALEAVLNLALVCEVAARMIAYGRSFFTRTINIVDAVLCAACVVSFVVYLVRTEDGVVFAVLLAVRYAVQCFRMWMYIRRRAAVTRSQSSVVDFTAVVHTTSGFDDE